MISPMTPEARQRLNRRRFREQSYKRQRIDMLIPTLLAAAIKGPFVRHLTCNNKSGCIQFRYAGRHVQYWIGVKKLLVKSNNSCTVYNDYTADQFARDVIAANPNHSFKL